MELTPTPPATASVSAPAAGSAAEAGMALSSDFETFLRMLTVQVQNQDPLSPMSSEDFAMQLATFSGVEQQVRSNELLEGLQAGLAADGLSGLAGWVGMETLGPFPAEFAGSPITLYPPPDAGSGPADLVVRDLSGREVQRLSVTLDGQPLSWAGIGEDGATLSAGRYNLEIERDSSAGPTSVPLASYALVAEVRIEGGAVMLRSAAGDEIPASEATALRTPPSP